MLNSVSGVSFKGDTTAANVQDLINSSGLYANSVAEMPPDSFERFGGEKEKKSKAPAIIASIVALTAAAYVGLGLAVGKGKLNKVVPKDGAELKFMEKAKNFLYDVGENAKGLWNKIRGKKTEDVKPSANENK